MAWGNGLKMDPYQKLNRTGNWRAKGLPYWSKRLSDCQKRIKEADSSAQLKRAIEAHDIAKAAVIQLSKD